MTSDMSAVIIPKSDQINADSLLSGPITITVSGVEIRPGTEQPCSIHYQGDNGKPYKPCKSMARALVACWGPDANNYVGRSMTLYCDPKVTWGGMAVGGIRISHMSHIERTETLMLTATKGNRKPFVIQPLKQSDAKPPPSTADKPPSAGTFNIIDVDGNPHDLGNADNWAMQIEKQAGKMTSAAHVSAFIDRNNGAISDAALTHPDIADGVRLMLMERKHDLEGAGS
jgi:hypothetical protein